MDTNLLERHFDRIGARIRVHGQRRWQQDDYQIDVGSDRAGEFFDFLSAKRSIFGSCRAGPTSVTCCCLRPMERGFFAAMMSGIGSSPQSRTA
jgi:hypothetical protein